MRPVGGLRWAWRRTDRHGEDDSRFSKFCEMPLKRKMGQEKILKWEFTLFVFYNEIYHDMKLQKGEWQRV